jgi:peptide/nickel transport system permease protein
LTAFLVRRIGQAIAVVFIVVLLVFVLAHLLPGGPRAMLGLEANPVVVKQFYAENGYNDPIPEQFVKYLWRLAHGNLGFSYHYNAGVGTLLVQTLPRSALLVGISYALGLLIAMPVGVLQAVRRGKPVDHALTAGALVIYSMPAFWLGLLMIIVFAIDLNWLPAEAPQGQTLGAIVSQPDALVLPVCTLAAGTIVVFSRFMRSSMLEALVQEYIRTARGKGVSERRVIWRHALRNAILPTITLIGLSLPYVLSGAIVTEQLFNYPGMGLLFWNAAVVHDYPVLLGFTIVVAVAAVTGSLLADVLYGLADPRLRVGRSG